MGPNGFFSFWTKVEDSLSKKVFFCFFLFLYFSKVNLHVRRSFFFSNFFSHCLCQLLALVCVIFEYIVLNSCWKSHPVFWLHCSELTDFLLLQIFLFLFPPSAILREITASKKEKEEGYLFPCLCVWLLVCHLISYTENICKKSCSLPRSFLYALGRKPQNPLHLSSSEAALGTLLSIQTSLERLGKV